MQNKPEDATDCEACKELRRGLRWTGKPPKCPKHNKELRRGLTWTGTPPKYP